MEKLTVGTTLHMPDGNEATVTKVGRRTTELDDGSRVNSKDLTIAGTDGERASRTPEGVRRRSAWHNLRTLTHRGDPTDDTKTEDIEAAIAALTKSHREAQEEQRNAMSNQARPHVQDDTGGQTTAQVQPATRRDTHDPRLDGEVGDTAGEPERADKREHPERYIGAERPEMGDTAGEPDRREARQAREAAKHETDASAKGADGRGNRKDEGRDGSGALGDHGAGSRVAASQRKRADADDHRPAAQRGRPRKQAE